MSFSIDNYLESLGEVRRGNIQEITLNVKYKGGSTEMMTFVNINGNLHKKEDIKKPERFSRNNYVRPDYARQNGNGGQFHRPSSTAYTPILNDSEITPEP